MKKIKIKRKDKSHPTWVRGLKPLKDKMDGTRRRSHPTWVRGLKQRNGPQ